MCWCWQSHPNMPCVSVNMLWWCLQSTHPNMPCVGVGKVTLTCHVSVLMSYGGVGKVLTLTCDVSVLAKSSPARPALPSTFSLLCTKGLPTQAAWEDTAPQKERNFKLEFNVALHPQRHYRLVGTGCPGRPPRLSHNSWALRNEKGNHFFNLCSSVLS